MKKDLNQEEESRSSKLLKLKAYLEDDSDLSGCDFGDDIMNDILKSDEDVLVSSLTNPLKPSSHIHDPNQEKPIVLQSPSKDDENNRIINDNDDDDILVDKRSKKSHTMPIQLEESSIDDDDDDSIRIINDNGNDDILVEQPIQLEEPSIEYLRIDNNHNNDKNGVLNESTISIDQIDEELNTILDEFDGSNNYTPLNHDNHNHHHDPFDTHNDDINHDNISDADANIEKQSTSIRQNTNTSTSSSSSSKRRIVDIPHFRRVRNLPQTNQIRDNESYTFRPIINRLPAMYGKWSDSNDSPFLERIRYWSEKMHQRKQIQMRNQRRREIENCTFEPQLNDRSNMIFAHKHARALTLSKLHRAVKRRYEHILETREMDYVKNCTFKPKLNEKSLKMAENARYNMKSSMKTRLQHSISDRYIDLTECTFQPVVKGVSKQMSLAMKYCQKQIFERLSLKTSEFNQTKRSSHETEIVKQQQQKKLNLREFFNRQQLMILRKKRRLKELTDEIYRIENGVKQNTNTNTNQRCDAFLKRQREIIQRKQQTIKVLENQINQTCVFQPKINANSARIAAESKYRIKEIVNVSAQNEQQQQDNENDDEIRQKSKQRRHRLDIESAKMKLKQLEEQRIKREKKNELMHKHLRGIWNDNEFAQGFVERMQVYNEMKQIHLNELVKKYEDKSEQQLLDQIEEQERKRCKMKNRFLKRHGFICENNNDDESMSIQSHDKNRNYDDIVIDEHAETTIQIETENNETIYESIIIKQTYDKDIIDDSTNEFQSRVDDEISLSSSNQQTVTSLEQLADLNVIDTDSDDTFSVTQHDDRNLPNDSDIENEFEIGEFTNVDDVHNQHDPSSSHHHIPRTMEIVIQNQSTHEFNSIHTHNLQPIQDNAPVFDKNIADILDDKPSPQAQLNKNDVLLDDGDHLPPPLQSIDDDGIDVNLRLRKA